jgi:membrane associated rhomboid family serine protease
MFRWVALYLTIFIAVVFAIQLFVPGFTESFLLVSAEAAERPWILVTSMFLHGDLRHLMGNMFGLLIFGLLLEKVIGYKNFLLVFFATGIAAGISALFLYDRILGVSGALFGIIGTLTALRPKMFIYIPGLTYMPLAAASVIYLLLDLGGLFYPSNIANLAHIAGMASGIIIGILWRKKFPEKTKSKREKAVSDEELDKWEDEYMKKSRRSY